MLVPEDVRVRLGVCDWEGDLVGVGVWVRLGVCVWDAVLVSERVWDFVPEFAWLELCEALVDCEADTLALWL